VVEATPVSPTPNQAGGSAPLRLEEGVAARLDQVGVTVLEQPADPSRFARRMPDRGVTDRPMIYNPSFELPNVVKSPAYNATYGYVHTEPLVGWGESDFDGQSGPNTICQLAPFRSTKAAHFSVFPEASDGRQVVLLSLSDKHKIKGRVERTWIYQSLGTIQPSDVGKTLQLDADVSARRWPKGMGKRDGAKATVAFTTNVTEETSGQIVGTPGVDNKVLMSEGFHRLGAEFTPDEGSVGKELSVLLMVENPKPQSTNDHYLFDDVHCRVISSGAGGTKVGDAKR
ncbi:MAG: hypothetical protein JW818_13320, partial [Pirellulales bacterium]|nr:hypothetical protein [Pirellulales bacterium]